MILGLINRQAVVRLVLFMVILFGGYVYFSYLPRESTPDVKIPVVMISTPHVGVSPRDIESLVTTPLENELASLKDIKKLSSSSVEGASIITLEFEPEVVIEDALQQVRERVNRAKSKLPADVEAPTVREISFSDVPVVIVTLAGDIPEYRLKELGDELSEDYRRLSGVLDATITGARDREIKVQVDPFRLSQLGLKLDDVTNALRSENVNIPGGNIRSGDANFLLRVPGDFKTAEDLEIVALKRIGDRPVLLRDVARVVDGYEERKSYARMNGQTALSIGVSKRTGSNILEVVNGVKQLTKEKANGKNWPASVRFRFLGDQSKMINDMVSELENGIITALILVVAVLLFAMGARNSLFVAFAIPTSMLLGMIVLAILGFTLNMIVLFSLILVLGMLVDNAIVIVENIYRHAERGAGLVEASVKGTEEVSLAVIASTATTVAAFLPLVFWTGIMGQFMGYMPKTIIVVLIASLVVAIGVLPVLTSKYVKIDASRTVEDDETKPINPQSSFMQSYVRLLELSIKRRYLVAGLGAVIFVGTFILYGALNHGVEFFPETEPNRATISLRAPDGTDLEATDKLVRQIENLLLAQENVDVYVAETGIAGGGDPLSGSQAAPQQARITVDFLPDKNTAKEGEKVRIEPTTETIDRLRAQFVLIPGAEIKIEKERMGPPVGADVAVEVSGDNFDKVGEAAVALRRSLLRDVDGIAELSHDYKVGRPEMRLRIDRARAKRVGASTQEVASTIRTAIAGTSATSIRDGENEYDVRVELMPEYRDNLQAVLALRIPGRIDTSPDTFQVPLSSVAFEELAGGSGTIRHIDQDLVVTISGNVKEGENPNSVRQAVQAFLDQKTTFPDGVSARIGGAQDEEQAASEFLGRAFIIAGFLILIVLVSQFNRYDIPVIVMVTVVLSLIGVFLGLMITGTPFGIMMTGLGVISLAGVVVNNAIVLLDYIEQLIQRGLSVQDAIIRAGYTRLRPVMLTAITTILGLIPMAIGLSFDFRAFKWITASQSATWWGPMAVAVIFGLGVATILTLIMVPVLYSIFNDFRGSKEPITISDSSQDPTAVVAAPAN